MQLHGDSPYNTQRKPIHHTAYNMQRKPRTIQRAPIRLHRFAGSSSADTSPKTNAKLESKILIPNHQVPVSASIVGASCERRGLGAGQKARLTFGPGPPGAIRAALRGVKISWREYRGDAALLLLVLLASCHYYSDAVGSPGSFALFLQACRATHARPLPPRIAWPPCIVRVP
jgi:hypothetical protein